VNVHTAEFVINLQKSVRGGMLPKKEIVCAPKTKQNILAKFIEKNFRGQRNKFCGNFVKSPSELFELPETITCHNIKEVIV
jgi:hypothetical protein